MDGISEEKYDIVKAIEKKDAHYRIIIDYVGEDRLKELFQIITDYYKNKEWRDRIHPSNITIEKHQGRDLSKCGREECDNLILTFDSFCSEFCLKNHVSLDEDEMK